MQADEDRLALRGICGMLKQRTWHGKWLDVIDSKPPECAAHTLFGSFVLILAKSLHPLKRITAWDCLTQVTCSTFIHIFSFLVHVTMLRLLDSLTTKLVLMTNIFCSNMVLMYDSTSKWLPVKVHKQYRVERRSGNCQKWIYRISIKHRDLSGF